MEEWHKNVFALAIGIVLFIGSIAMFSGPRGTDEYP